MARRLFSDKLSNRKPASRSFWTLWRTLFSTLAIAASLTTALSLGNRQVAIAQGIYCPSSGGFTLSYAGENYAGSAAMTEGSTTTGGTFTFIAANIDGTRLIMGEFTVSAGDCALGAETGLILVNGNNIDVNYNGPAQGDWPPAPPDTYYGNRLAIPFAALGEIKTSNEGVE